MTKPSAESTSDNSTDDLAAYLDGELSREETLALETRLATDPALRRELGQLQKTWDMLDVLPRAKADESFSTTTMSLAADLVKKDAAARNAFRFSPRFITTIVGLLLAIASLSAGYFAVTYASRQPQREINEELHLLTNFVTYSRLSENYLGDKNLEFLKLLQSSGLFVAPENGDTPTPPEPTSFEGLPAEDQAEVVRHYQTLKNEGEGKNNAKFNSMKQLAKEIGSDPGHVGLLRIYDRYYAWLQALPNKREILKIESERDPSARVELIRTSWRQQSQQNLQAMLSDLQVILTAKDYDVFRTWFADFVTAHEVEIKEKLKGNELKGQAAIILRDVERVTDPQRKQMWLYGIYSWRVGEEKAIIPDQEEFKRLTTLLSDEVRQKFLSIEANEEERRKVVKSLLLAAFKAHSLPPATDEDRAKILASLSVEEREKLEKLKAMELKRELTKRFDEQRINTPRERKGVKKGGGPQPTEPKVGEKPE